MKATTLLEHQHRNLEELCETVERGSASMRASLLPQLADDVSANVTVEEQVFYPAACEALQTPGWLDACHAYGVEVHRSLQRALQAPVEGEEFVRAIGELRDLLSRHALEERDQLFPLLEKALDAGAMRQLGQSMLARYGAELDAGYAGTA